MTRVRFIARKAREDMEPIEYPQPWEVQINGCWLQAFHPGRGLTTYMRIPDSIDQIEVQYD